MKQVYDSMKKAIDYTLTKSDRKTKVPLLAYFVSKIIEYNNKKDVLLLLVLHISLKRRYFSMTGIIMKKIQKQIHCYQRKNKSALIDHIISGTSKMFSDNAENYTPDLFKGLFSTDPTTDEDKHKLADELDQVYKNLYEQKKEEETPMENEEETPMGNDDDDERNPPAVTTTSSSSPPHYYLLMKKKVKQLWNKYLKKKMTMKVK